MEQAGNVIDRLEDMYFSAVDGEDFEAATTIMLQMQATMQYVAMKNELVKRGEADGE